MEAMAGAPCGCDLRDHAATLTDPRGRGVLDSDGARAQRAWSCPRVTAPDDVRPLPPEAIKALDAVHRLCGVAPDEPREWTGCPCLAARDPAAHEVAALLPWYRKGQLHLRCPYPTGAMVDAIDVTESALAAREADEMRRLRAKSEVTK